MENDGGFYKIIDELWARYEPFIKNCEKCRYNQKMEDTKNIGVAPCGQLKCWYQHFREEDEKNIYKDFYVG